MNIICQSLYYQYILDKFHLFKSPKTFRVIITIIFLLTLGHISAYNMDNTILLYNTYFSSSKGILTRFHLTDLVYCLCQIHHLYLMKIQVIVHWEPVLYHLSGFLKCFFFWYPYNKIMM